MLAKVTAAKCSLILPFGSVALGRGPDELVSGRLAPLKRAGGRAVSGPPTPKRLTIPTPSPRLMAARR